jgi:hypothetical protein
MVFCGCRNFFFAVFSRLPLQQKPHARSSTHWQIGQVEGRSGVGSSSVCCIKQTESLRAAVDAAAAAKAAHCGRSAVRVDAAAGVLVAAVSVVVSCGVAVLSSVPIDRLRSLTPAQPDVVPHPDKAGGKMGDYWTPLKKRCNIARERFCCARVTLPLGCLIRILCGALCS